MRQRIYSQFLVSCRNLREGRSYWEQANRFTKWFLQIITPTPLLELHPGGKIIIDALEWLDANCRKVALSEKVIRQYHGMVYDGDDGKAGEYRNRPITVMGSTIPRSPASKIAALMKQLDIKIQQKQKRYETLFAGRSHQAGLLSRAAGR